MWCVCAQLYMDQSKKNFDHFICFWKWFLSFFVSMFSAYFVFHCLSMFCVEKQVSEFLATHSGDLQVTRPNHEFWRLAICDTQSRDYTECLGDSLMTCQSRNAQNQLFKELFRGKPVLNLSHPLLNPSFNIFTSKPNQFEWVFIPLTFLR